MSFSNLSKDEIKDVAIKLWNYCLKNNFSGYDPYDALNSKLLKLLPGGGTRFFRLAATQGLKRLPINIRPLLLIPRTQNPKALAIFSKAALRLNEAGIIKASDEISYLIKRISELRSPGLSYYCWGYSFPWQTRTILVPAGSPNLVCTVFVADSLLDAWQATGDNHCLEMAMSAGQYILNELYWNDNGNSGFSYPQPGIKIHIYNADLLASALLARLSFVNDNKQYLEPALTVARYAVSRQNEDGSWYYGETPGTAWIDNFHTGYNLLALRDMSLYTRSDEFSDSIRRGFEFYKKSFFREDGSPKYYHNKLYPIDIHCAAQSIITLEALRDLDISNEALALSVLDWTLKNMWNKRGYFYYQVMRFYKNRISYMRWSQAWMLLALAELLKNKKTAFIDCLKSVIP
ncbi:MAG: hypothetical protein QME85_08650 [Candidatus Saccharicenans sp.]|nr:hypothetical protein [Candidatus Saccharicenans sp.]MDI6848907.1 hypothetical protein [Candidatus Saccharicenans sp.]